MSDIVGELARVRGAYEQPTLTLLHQRAAPVIIAIFRTSFGRDTRSIPTARLHDQVDAYLRELLLAGMEDLPAGDGRALCIRWMRGQWLVRSTEDDGSEIYSLTSYAQAALTLVKGLTRERAGLNEHRIATIISAVRRFNTEVNPDRAARVSNLNEDIERLSRERDRLAAGGELSPVSEDYMLEGYGELLELVAALPSEFARVAEAFVALRSEILASFRAEDRPAGVVIDDYLDRADMLMAATPEGRAFEGAFALLRDPALLLQLREDLVALLSHPLAKDILLEADQRDLLGIVNLIRTGIEDVLTRRNRVTATLRDYIVTHDITRDRELDNTLRLIDAELTGWMKTAGPRSTVPLALLPARANVTHLRERFHDPINETAPPPLVDVSDQRPNSLSLQELRMQGGPTLGSLHAALVEALSAPDPAASLGVLFDSLAPALRRPVEIFGLLHLATNRQDLEHQDATEVYMALRPDGTNRNLSVPRVVPAAAKRTLAPGTEPDHDDSSRDSRTEGVPQ
jgi:hypothetical protein